MAQLAAEKPALLVLDEPTNHLDLDMRDALALALQAYTGAVLIVAHDRDLLEKIVDELWVVQDGTLSTYDGNLEEYTAGVVHGFQRGHRRPARFSTCVEKEQRRERAASRSALAHLKKQVKDLEKQLERGTADLKDVEQTLADEATYSELTPDALNELLAKAGKLRQDVESIEDQWMEAVEQLEAQPDGKDH